MSQHWLDRYASGYHAWQDSNPNGRRIFRRRIGVVESAFDTDGTDFEGRADVNAFLILEARNTLGTEELRKRVLLAWTSLRLQHALLLARVERQSSKDCFVIEPPVDYSEALATAGNQLVFVDDHYPDGDAEDFYRHALNTGRVLDPERSLSRLFILSSRGSENKTHQFQAILIAAHEITDGLAMYSWQQHFMHLLNSSSEDLQASIEQHRRPEQIWARLPPAQEDLYPPVAGNVARQRWYWAIVRILRHVRKPLPQGLTNPLRRDQRHDTATEMPPNYPAILNYSPNRKPPLNTFFVGLTLPQTASHRLQQLVKDANASVGAGCFALVGLAMMELYEKQHPSVPLADRKPFVASFPLNPRPFFGYNGPADSCMLAFSDGIVMPFLPSSLPVEGRFRLLAKIAHRQLRMYQKRLRDPDLNLGLSPHNPARMIATNYIAAVERAETKLPPERRTGMNPQGAYPANYNFGSATCGVSSVGSVKDLLSPGMFDLSKEPENGLVADYRSLRSVVRARDNEFLVGSAGDNTGIHFFVSYDGNAVPEEKAQEWKAKMETLLEPGERSRL
ncbi:hypothetical protein H2201_000706 [Coniosporium apollinis]|uniref:Condensation domain-containing protein n=1 Tax=Coniosporium apollinis TaxID=61459 RepID=A0ABQ9P437_9PEZI|nr:hypothetical protein H2201_000706 [Coniosporium apollinis]